MHAAKQQVIKIKKTGTICTIPNDNMAHLMYYLRSIDSLTDFGIPSELKNYDNYYNLSFDQENQVIALAFLLSPDFFIEKGIMINQPNLCFDCGNEFYEIYDSRLSFSATHEFVICGKTVRTLSIMAFKMSWIETHYLEPIKCYEKRLLYMSNGRIDELRPRSTKDDQSNDNFSSSNYSISSTSNHSVSKSNYPKKKSKKCIIC